MLLVAVVLAASPASAEPASTPDEATKQRAHAAYERGTKASDAGDYETAARAFAEADELAPNPVALEAALDVCVLADDPVFGTELLERARREPGVDPKTIAKADAKFAGRAGRIDVGCAHECTVSIDGAPAVERSIWVKTGPHHVSIRDGSASLERDVTVDAGAPVSLRAEAETSTRPTPPSARLERERIVSPVFAYVGIGITAGLAAGLVASGLDAKAKHDDYLAAAPADKAAAADAGRSSALRTNILVGVAAAAGAATVTLGILALPIGPKKAAKSAVTLRVGPTGLAVAGSL